MRILVSGITGAIGSELTPRLLGAGHEVIGLSRQPAASPDPNWTREVAIIHGDAVSGLGLRRALREVDVAYYLIHSMEPQSGPRFESHELLAAENFARAAVRSGVGRLVYLGGLMPSQPASSHLTSRLQVERTLMHAVSDSFALRASIVIGARSRSFRFLVRLVERMPVLLIPGWRRHRTAPVDIRDVVECLARAATDVSVGGRSLDVGGPDTVTYGALIERIRDLLVLNRPVINLPGPSVTPITSRLSAVITGEQHALIGPLMEGLTSDLLPRGPDAAQLLDVRRHSLDAAIEHALHEWERSEPLRAR